MKEHFEDSNISLESKFKQKYLLQFMYTRIILLKCIKYLLRKQLQNEISQDTGAWQRIIIAH